MSQLPSRSSSKVPLSFPDTDIIGSEKLSEIKNVPYSIKLGWYPSSLISTAIALTTFVSSMSMGSV